MGIGVSGLSNEEMLHRAANRCKLLNEAQPYSPDMLPHIIPGSCGLVQPQNAIVRCPLSAPNTRF